MNNAKDLTFNLWQKEKEKKKKKVKGIVEIV